MSTITLKGTYYTYLYGPDGELKDFRKGENIVTTGGKEFIARFLASAGVAASTFSARYVGIGTGSTSETASDSALSTELSRQTGTVSYISGQIYQVSATFTSGMGTGAIVEYGLFSSNSGGTLLSRDTEEVINKGSSDTLTVVYQLTLS